MSGIKQKRILTVIDNNNSAAPKEEFRKRLHAAPWRHVQQR